MKGLKVFGYVVGAAIVGIGAAMAVTNPDQTAYDEFATRQLTAYLDEQFCDNAPGFLGNTLQEQCKAFLDGNQSEIRAIIASNTERQNYFLFSIYKTNLSAEELLPPILSDAVPSYHFETVGLFQSFQIYRADRANDAP